MEKKEYTINLKDLLIEIRRYLILLVAVALLCGAIGFCWSSFFIAPTYAASAKMVVNTRQELTGNVTNDQITSAQKLVDTYAIIIRSRTTLVPVIEKLGLSTSYEDLYRRVSVAAVNETMVLQITVKDTDPTRASNIVREMLAILPGIITSTVEVGSVKTVEDVYCSGHPVAPNKTQYTLICAAIGALIVLVVVIIRFCLDNTYKSEIQLREDLNVPVLGVIPSLESCSRNRKENSNEKE